jgi:hypothetical protein
MPDNAAGLAPPVARLAGIRVGAGEPASGYSFGLQLPATMESEATFCQID